MASTVKQKVASAAIVSILVCAGWACDKPKSSTVQVDNKNLVADLGIDKSQAFAYLVDESHIDPLGSTIGVASSVAELMPNVKIQLFGDTYAPNTHTVVLARPVDVQFESAEIWSDPLVENPNGDPTPRQVTEEDPSAESRTWLITLEVSEVLAGKQPKDLLSSQQNPKKIQVRISGPGGELDADLYKAGLLALGRSVWFLYAEPDTYKDAFGIAWGGGAVATVSGNGSIAFPLLRPEIRQQIGENAFNLDTLRTQGQKPETTVPRP